MKENLKTSFIQGNQSLVLGYNVCYVRSLKIVAVAKQASSKTDYTSSFAWLSRSRACSRVTKFTRFRFHTSENITKHVNLQLIYIYIYIIYATLKLKKSALACFYTRSRKIWSFKNKKLIIIFRTTDSEDKLFRAFPLESATKTRPERLHKRAWFTNIFSPLNFSCKCAFSGVMKENLVHRKVEFFS